MSSTMVQAMNSSLQSGSSDRGHGSDDAAAILRHPISSDRREQTPPHSPSNASPSRAARKRRPEDRDNTGRRRLDDGPRFNIAAPTSPARRVQPAAPARRGRKQVYIPAPTHLQVDTVDDNPIPDYPPPSFQEAISSSPYPPTFPLPSADSSSLAHRPVHTPILPPPSLPGPTSQPDHVEAVEDIPSPVLSNFSMDEEDSGLSPDTGSDTDSIEFLSLDPLQRWEAERQLGLSVEERAAREFERRRIAESTTTLALPQAIPSQASSSPTSPYSPTLQMHRCSHCGSARPSNCDGETHDVLETSEEADEITEPVKFRRLKFLGKRHIRINKDHSSPSVPSSPISPTSISRMPSAWASNLTLSLGGALTSHRLNPLSRSPGKRENTGIRKLFSSKGKDRPPTPPDPIGEPFESWEVVIPHTDETRQSMVQMPYVNITDQRAALRVTPPASSLAYSVPNTSPSSPFLERPVRRLQQVSASPTALSSSVPTSPLTQNRPRLPSEAPSLMNPTLSSTVVYDRRFSPTYMAPPREKIRRF